MPNPFQTERHCARYASRVAHLTGETLHVILTGEPAAPLTVIKDQTLHSLADVLDGHDVVFTADPFDAVA